MHPIADKRWRGCIVRFVPIADIVVGQYSTLDQSGGPQGLVDHLCTENPIRIDWGGNHLTSAHNDRAAVFCPYRLGLAIQVEEPA